MKRSRECTRESIKWRTYDNAGRSVLKSSFAVDKEKELVLDDRAADVTSELASLKLRGRRKGSGLGTVAKESETFAVKSIRPRLCCHVDCAR